MRPDTKRKIVSVVGLLENYFLDTLEPELITLKEAVEYCYDEFLDNSMVGDTNAVRFEGKNNILKTIEEEIKSRPDIKVV